MIVDTHTHLWQSLEQLGPQISAQLRQRYPVADDRLDAGPAAHEAAAETVDVAFVLGLRSVALEIHIPAAAISDHIARRRDRLIGFAGIDPLADDAFDQLDALPALKLSGIVLSPAEQNCHPLHSRAMRVYDKAQSLSLPVIFHQGSPFVRDAHLEYARPALLDEVARSFPSLRLLVTHGGHPFIDELLTLIAKHRNVYTELSDIAARPWQLYQALIAAHQMDVTDSVLFGSNFPQLAPQRAIEAIYSINQYAQGSALPAVPREKLRAIVERDALAALGLKRGSADESAPIKSAPAPAPQRVSSASSSSSRAESDS